MSKRIILLTFFSLFNIGIGLFIAENILPAYAAIPVVDIANTTETHANYLQALQTAINTAKQIENQLRELQGLPGSFLASFQNDFDKDLQNIKTTANQFQGIMNPAKTAEQAWNDTFYTKDNYADSSVVDRLRLDKNIIYALDQSYKDAFNLVKQTEVTDKDIENLNQALEANKSVAGNKEALQIQNTLSGQLVELRAKELSVKRAEASATVTYYQRQNQLEAAAADVARKHVEALNAH